MKRILTIGPNYRTLGGGIAAVLSTYAKYDKNFDFMPTYSSENNVLNIFLFPWSVFKIIIYLLKNPDVSLVHIHSASYISFYRKYILFLVVKKMLGRKVIYHIHGAEFHLFYEHANFFTKKMIRSFLEGSDAIIVLSKQWKSFFMEEFKIKKIFILNNTIPYPEQIGLRESDVVNFLFLGQIGQRKGIFDMLEAISSIKEQLHNKARFYIGGDGEVEKLQQKIKEYQLEEIVKFIGWVTGSKKEALLKKSHVYVLPSYNEGLPISILEAMSYKMPIISTPVGGIPEILKNGKNGIIVEAGNRVEIKDSLLYFIDNFENIKSMGKESFNMVQDFFPEKVIKDLHEIYLQV